MPAASQGVQQRQFGEPSVIGHILRYILSSKSSQFIRVNGNILFQGKCVDPSGAHRQRPPEKVRQVCAQRCDKSVIKCETGGSYSAGLTYVFVQFW